MALINEIENQVTNYLDHVKFSAGKDTYEDIKFVMDDFLHYLKTPAI